MSALVLGGCASHASEPPVAPVAPGESASAAMGPRIEFVENDYAHALSLARKADKPLFVDAWAPWCHTCLSMKAFVFERPEIRAQAANFVWLSMDTETAPGQEFVAKFPQRFWPTLWVIDAKKQTPTLKWEAAATAPELARLLRAAVSPGGGIAESARLRGDHAAAVADLVVAIGAYREALQACSPAWPERPQTVEALALALEAAREPVACVELADAEYETLPAGTSKANVALAGFRCAGLLPSAAPNRKMEERRTRLLTIARARDATFPLLADDRSDIYNTLVEQAQSEGPEHDPGRARVLAGEWSAFVEREAAEARTAAARAVFDSHRLLADIARGHPVLAVPMLEQSARDFPDDYNPPARLARALLAIGTPASKARARTEIDRALGLVYGPRRFALVLTKCDVLEALGTPGDAAEEKSLLDSTLRSADAASATGGTRARVRDLQDRLDKLNASGA